jgi:hypothetical protein
MPPMSHRSILILGLLLPALIAVGCGGDDDETTPAKPAELVTLRPDGYDYTGSFGPSHFGGTGDGPLAEAPPADSTSSGSAY